MPHVWANVTPPARDAGRPRALGMRDALKWVVTSHASAERRPSGPDRQANAKPLGDGMNNDILQGKWEQLKGKARIKWGKLTNDDMDQIQGEREKLVGKLRERYGLAQERAESDVDDWLETQH